MDNTDRKLLYLMWEDPRMSLREISKRLGISRQTVHRRLQAFERIGVFSNMRACIAGVYIDEFVVAIWGKSESNSIDSCLDRLGESRFTWRVEVLGGNALFIMAGLTDLTDLDRYVKFVRTAAEMPEPTVGIMCYEDGLNPYDVPKKESYKELSPLDLKIITSLHQNARRPAAEIANELGVSAKTVRRHLEEMISDGSMVYNQPWDVAMGEDSFTLLFLKLRKGADKARTAKRLLSIDPIRFFYLRSFSNIPDFLVGLVFSEHARETRRIVGEIAQDEDVPTVTPNPIFDERMYWDQDPRSPVVLSHTPKGARNKKGAWARPQSLLVDDSARLAG